MKQKTKVVLGMECVCKTGTYVKLGCIDRINSDGFRIKFADTSYIDINERSDVTIEPAVEITFHG